jgi:hypothetical protein
LEAPSHIQTLIFLTVKPSFPKEGFQGYQVTQIVQLKGNSGTLTLISTGRQRNSYKENYLHVAFHLKI